MEFFIKIGGVFLFICAMFHVLFPKMYHWKKLAENLPQEDSERIINTLKLMNVCQFILWIIFSGAALFFPQEMLHSAFGIYILTTIIIFWIIRIFILQPIYIGFKTKLAKIQTAFFVIGLVAFIIPWFYAIFKK